MRHVQLAGKIASRFEGIAKTNLQASRASDTETLQSQVNKAAKKTTLAQLERRTRMSDSLPLGSGRHHFLCKQVLQRCVVEHGIGQLVSSLSRPRDLKVAVGVPEAVEFVNRRSNQESLVFAIVGPLPPPSQRDRQGIRTIIMRPRINHLYLGFDESPLRVYLCASATKLRFRSVTMLADSATTQ
jgi:hypothetical protein